MTLNNQQGVDYCKITAPMLGTIWNQNCSVEIQKVLKGMEGDWEINIGHEGRIEEQNVKSAAKVYGKYLIQGVELSKQLKNKIFLLRKIGIL